MKKETLEEAALNIIPDRSTAGWIDSFSATERIGFIKGAKWQQERMYSEEELREAFKQGHSFARKGSYNQITEQEDFDKRFEKFKKK